MAEYIAMTWYNFYLVNLFTGVCCMLAGRLAGELKYNREGVIGKVRQVFDELVG